MKNLKFLKVFLIFSGLCLVANAAMAKSKIIEPKIENKKIVLGADVIRAIKAQNPKFKILKSKSFAATSIELSDGVPMAVVADFNADGLQDVALYGVDSAKKRTLVYMVVSSAVDQKYHVFEVLNEDLEQNILRNNNSYLSGNQLLKHKRDVLLIEYFDEALAGHSVYYFSNSKNSVIAHRAYEKFHP